MSFARAISRGLCLKARFGVNGTKNASRSFGTVGASGRVASDMVKTLLRIRRGAGGFTRPYSSHGTQAEWRARRGEMHPRAAVHRNHPDQTPHRDRENIPMNSTA